MQYLISSALLIFTILGFWLQFKTKKNIFNGELKKAESGDASAQYNIAEMYFNGEGVSKNYQEAEKWYVSSAEQGNLKAAYELGEMYAKGEVVDRDYVKAYKWYDMLVKQGEETAVQICNDLMKEMTEEQKLEVRKIL